MANAFDRRALGAIFLGAACPKGQAAEALPAPQGRVILSISGRISNANKEGTADFDRAMLEALGMDSFETVTPWYEGRVRFEGVRMTKLMTTVGAAGPSITAIALNNYSTDIPIADFERYGTLLALKRDGVYLTVRDKGPLFIVYPYDSSPELKAQQFYGRSAWQVAKLVVG